MNLSVSFVWYNLNSYNDSPHWFSSLLKQDLTIYVYLEICRGYPMQTTLVPISTDILPEYLQMALELLQNNEIVAFPTETVYGLGADIFSEQAIARIYEAKGRPLDNPLIVHISELAQLERLVEYIPSILPSLAKHFWPGALTFVLKKKEDISDKVTGGLDTIAVRMPNNPIALKLITAFGSPLAAPSANLSGKPSPTSAMHVFKDFNGKVPLIFDGGETQIGIESTVLDLVSDPPTILRPGGVTYEQLKEFLPNLTIHCTQYSNDNEAVRSPGMKYRHYAPDARLIAVLGDKERQLEFIDSEVERLGTEKKRVLCLHHEHDHKKGIDYVLVGKSKQEIQHNLYKVLRKLDEDNVNLAFIESVDERDEGYTIMNRIFRATEEIIKV